MSKRKSPRTKSPQKKLNKTPSSATKKAARKLILNDDDPKPSTSRVVSTKRALFQSPEKTRSTIGSTSSDLILQRGKSRRNLFVSPKKQSPAKRNSPLKSICDRKRKRHDEECHPNKFPRSLSFDVHQTKQVQGAGGSSLTRRHSELSVGSVRGEMSDLHKKVR